MSYVITPLGDAEDDALIDELSNFSILGAHPIDKAHAAHLVTKASAFIKKKAAIGAIPVVAIGTLLTYLILRKKKR